MTDETRARLSDELPLLRAMLKRAYFDGVLDGSSVSQRSARERRVLGEHSYEASADVSIARILDAQPRSEAPAAEGKQAAFLATVKRLEAVGEAQPPSPGATMVRCGLGVHIFAVGSRTCDCGERGPSPGAQAEEPT